MTPFHGRWRARVSLLAMGALAPEEGAAVRAHLEGCAPCRADLARTERALGVLAADPALTAEPPVPLAFLQRRVLARLDEAPSARPRRWGLAVAAVAAAALAVVVVPAVVSRLRPTPSAIVDIVEQPVPEDVIERMERRLARDQAARYLDEAQDVLVTVSARPADCERERGRIDVEAEAERSRRLLQRRALLVDLGGDEVAAARPLLEDVDGLLREVAALPSCARADALLEIHRRMERRNVLMKIDLLTRELRG